VRKEYQKIAVFDIDGTLVVGSSVEVQLIHLLNRNKEVPFSNYLQTFLSMASQLPLGFRHVIRRKSVYLEGLSVKRVLSFLPEMFETRLRPRFSKAGLSIINRLKDKGYEIVFISGTFDFVVDYLVKKLGAHGGLGSIIETKDGKFTGRIRGIHPYYYGKLTILNQYLEDRSVDYSNSYGFADSWADIPLLSLFGHSIALNPGRLLEKRAKKLGWPIIKG
jgi:HAD superfamily hydrolase (TIGR01490 family)